MRIHEIGEALIIPFPGRRRLQVYDVSLRYKDRTAEEIANGTVRAEGWVFSNRKMVEQDIARLAREHRFTPGPQGGWWGAVDMRARPGIQRNYVLLIRHANRAGLDRYLSRPEYNLMTDLLKRSQPGT